MNQPFALMLTVGGKSNSLGKTADVIERVIEEPERLHELYACLFDSDAWVRMRAADALEKICRDKPAWIEPLIDRLQAELSDSTQASIQWHMAQIYRIVCLSDKQFAKACSWLEDKLSTPNIDWIVSANAMDTLMQFTEAGTYAKSKLEPLIEVQLHHKSKSVVRRAKKLKDKLAKLD